MIEDAANWNKKDYFFIFHNCQNFVEFCLKKIEVEERKRKKCICYFQENIDIGERIHFLLEGLSQPITKTRKYFESRGKEKDKRKKFDQKMRSKMNCNRRNTI